MSQVGRNLSRHFSLHKLCVASCPPFTLCCHQTPISFLPSLVGSSVACSQSACNHINGCQMWERQLKNTWRRRLKGQAEEKYPFCTGASLLFSSFASCDTILKNNLSEGRKKSGLSIAELKVLSIALTPYCCPNHSEIGRDIRLMYRVLSTFE